MFQLKKIFFYANKNMNKKFGYKQGVIMNILLNATKSWINKSFDEKMSIVINMLKSGSRSFYLIFNPINKDIEAISSKEYDKNKRLQNSYIFYIIKNDVESTDKDIITIKTRQIVKEIDNLIKQLISHLSQEQNNKEVSL